MCFHRNSNDLWKRFCVFCLQRIAWWKRMCVLCKEHVHVGKRGCVFKHQELMHMEIRMCFHLYLFQD